MNISVFFSAIIFALSLIFVLFKPLNIKQQNFGEIPVFELMDFKLMELNEKGLTTVINGDKGTRYNDRYLVNNIDYTDNTKEYLANMKANEGVYRENVIDLEGDIVYTREDGISFSTEKASYNKETNIVVSPTSYIAYIGENKVTGSYIEYNNALETTASKNVTVNYKLKER
ncbi:MAG: LPS export ABC transporter periplasmic protein LptC [Helicobacteraceae bacterium]|nr:LPS export ABC transporter periplasmic protein LptC [Candidatus Sulfurimonas ponti]MBL6972803.1 LPS export ABC transporter periplasmic protein LptC [Sulfurimonas sp.]